MKKHILKIFSLFLFITFAFPLQNARGVDDDDFQYWHTTIIKKKLPNNFFLRASSEERLRDTFQYLFFVNGDIGLFYQPFSFFEFGSAYRFEHEESLAGKDSNEHRWILEGTLKANYRGFLLQSRHRFTYRNKSTRDSWRYRTRQKIAYPLTYGDFKLTPYLSDEVFIDTIADRFNQNRFSAGLTFPITKQLALSTYYLLKSDRVQRNGKWNDSHVLGTEISISI